MACVGGGVFGREEGMDSNSVKWEVPQELSQGSSCSTPINLFRVFFEIVRGIQIQR